MKSMTQFQKASPRLIFNKECVSKFMLTVCVTTTNIFNTASYGAVLYYLTNVLVLHAVLELLLNEWLICIAYAVHTFWNGVYSGIDVWATAEQNINLRNV